MTEKNMSGKINELLETLKDDEKRQAFLNDFEEFLNNYHQPSFAVGEYYATTRGGIIYLITDILSDHKAYSKALLGDRLSNEFIKSDGKIFKDSKPATAEQIATFKRAEHFASKGRKLDEFRDRDIVKYEGELFFAKTTSESNLISVSGFDDYGWDDMNADEFDLIQTAEELQEVGE